MKRLYLGIDGGASSTTACRGVENGVVLAIGTAGPCNHVKASRGAAKLRGAVLGSIRKAWKNVPFPGSRKPVFDSAFLGMAGGPDDKAAIIAEIIECRRLEVTHDAVTALMGATHGRPGIIVIAGTGSIGFGMNGAGQTARAGGWGYLYGDEGSAFDTARQALRAALRQEEGWGRPTVLLKRIIEFSSAKDVNEVMHLWYNDDFPRNRVASFTRIVDEAARAGDSVARSLLRNAAAELAHLVARIRPQIFKAREEVLVSYIGGAFHSRLMLDRFRRLVRGQGVNRVLPPALGPAAGALLAAYRAAGRGDVRLRNLPPEL